MLAYAWNKRWDRSADRMQIIRVPTLLMRRFVVPLSLLGLMLVGAGAASGQAYPRKPIRRVCRIELCFRYERRKLQLIPYPGGGARSA